MNNVDSINLVSEITRDNKINLPEEAGVYAFWWMGDKEVLMNSNLSIVLKGPKGVDVNIEYKDWWPLELLYPCLYVGKSTNIKNRFSLHIKRGSPERLHNISKSNKKEKPVTTSCQLRHGIEHIFKNEQAPLELINNNVGFSYTTDFGSVNQTVERFFTEDKLIGTWRPWFNIDSER